MHHEFDIKTVKYLIGMDWSDFHHHSIAARDQYQCIPEPVSMSSNPDSNLPSQDCLLSVTTILSSISFIVC